MMIIVIKIIPGNCNDNNDIDNDDNNTNTTTNNNNTNNNNDNNSNDDIALSKNTLPSRFKFQMNYTIYAKRPFQVAMIPLMIISYLESKF